MADQFVIPQFLEVESKILGPITVRQFLILMVVGLVGLINYKLFDDILFLLITIPLAIVGVVVAFVKINGQGMHFVILNLLVTLRRPALRVWNKSRTDADLRARIQKKDPPPPPEPYRKPPLTSSRLRDLSLVVNTGGVFIPDDDADSPAHPSLS